MKVTIVLKKIDADGFGGEILASMGMARSKHEPQVFSARHSSRDPYTQDTGDGSWTQPEELALKYVEALTDYGIRPVRVFIKTDSTAGMTPIAASVPKRETSIADALSQVEAAVDLLDSKENVRTLGREVKTMASKDEKAAAQGRESLLLAISAFEANPTPKNRQHAEKWLATLLDHIEKTSAPKKKG